MAYGTKRQSTAKPRKMITVTYPKDGPVEELRGLECEVPADVIDKRGWIERKYQQELEAELSQQAARDKQAAADAEAKDSLSPEVAALKQQVGDLQEVIAGLNTSEAIQISTNASESVKTMLQVYNELKVLKDSVEADRQAAQELRDETAQIKEDTAAQIEQQKKINRNFAAMMNENQRAANEQTKLAQELADQQLKRVTELRDHLDNGNGMIDDARRFREENGALFAEMAADTVNAQLTSNESDLVAFANLVLHAAGIDREKWNDTMAQLRTDPTSLRYNLTRDGIREAAAEFNVAAATRTEEELVAMHEADQAVTG